MREADSDVLCALADLYGISLDELVGRVEAQSSTEDPEQELIGLFRKMNKDGREALMVVARGLAEKFAK